MPPSRVRLASYRQERGRLYLTSHNSPGASPAVTVSY